MTTRRDSFSDDIEAFHDENGEEGVEYSEKDNAVAGGDDGHEQGDLYERKLAVAVTLAADEIERGLSSSMRSRSIPMPERNNERRVKKSTVVNGQMNESSTTSLSSSTMPSGSVPGAYAVRGVDTTDENDRESSEMDVSRGTGRFSVSRSNDCDNEDDGDNSNRTNNDDCVENRAESVVPSPLQATLVLEEGPSVALTVATVASNTEQAVPGTGPSPVEGQSSPPPVLVAAERIQKKPWYKVKRIRVVIVVGLIVMTAFVLIVTYSVRALRPRRPPPPIRPPRFMDNQAESGMSGGTKPPKGKGGGGDGGGDGGGGGANRRRVRGVRRRGVAVAIG